MESKKVAVVFPGIGYHSDKPLLYYAKKIAKKYGYQILEVSYSGFSKDNMIGNAAKMQDAFESARSQARDVLKDVSWQEYEEILFLSKSIGTAVAAAIHQEIGIDVKHVYFTPVEGTFRYMAFESGIAFHGTSDPWVTTEIVKNGCAEKSVPLYITEKANHSLETGNVSADLGNMKGIMGQVEKYLWTLSPDVFRVVDIREDDYGCEEIPEGQPVMVQVILEDPDRLKQMMRYADAELVQKKIVEGDLVQVTKKDGMAKLNKL